MAFFVAMVLWTHPSGFPWFPLFLATGIIGVFVTKALYAATPFLAWDLPLRTVGELAQMLLSLNPNEFDGEAQGGRLMSRDEVWGRIVRIIHEQQGIAWEEILPEARIVEDLGID